jgi:hypothetical protein
MAWRFPGLRSFFHPSLPLLTHMVLLLLAAPVTTASRLRVRCTVARSRVLRFPAQQPN